MGRADDGDLGGAECTERGSARSADVGGGVGLLGRAARYFAAALPLLCAFRWEPEYAAERSWWRAGEPFRGRRAGYRERDCRRTGRARDTEYSGAYYRPG